jgi:hypothetical protein
LPNAGELGKRLRSLRYSLDDSSGDPATALARLVARIDRAPAPPPVEVTAAARGKDRKVRTPIGFEASEPTVLRIRTADGFADDHTGTNLLAAKRVIDRFEEDETRMSRLPAPFGELPTTRTGFDSMDVPTSSAPLHLPPEPGELTAPAAPLDVDGPRGRQRLRAPSQAEPPPIPPRAPARPPVAAPPPTPAPPPPAAPPPPRLTEPMAPAPAAYPPPSRPALPRPASAPAYPMPASPPPGYAARAPSSFTPAGAAPSRRWWFVGAAAVAIAVGSFFITRAALRPPELPHPPVITVDAGDAADGKPTALPAKLALDAGPGGEGSGGRSRPRTLRRRARARRPRPTPRRRQRRRSTPRRPQRRRSMPHRRRRSDHRRSGRRRRSRRRRSARAGRAARGTGRCGVPGVDQRAAGAATSRTTASSTAAPQRRPSTGMRSSWPWNISAKRSVPPRGSWIFTGAKPYQRAPACAKYLPSVKPGMRYGTTVASGSNRPTWRWIAVHISDSTGSVTIGGAELHDLELDVVAQHRAQLAQEVLGRSGRAGCGRRSRPRPRRG